MMLRFREGFDIEECIQLKVVFVLVLGMQHMDMFSYEEVDKLNLHYSNQQLD